MSQGRRNLGRGLAALLGDEEEPSAEEESEALAEARDMATEVAVAHIRPGRFQPRHSFDDAGIEDLVESVREKGILQPLLVRPDPDTPERYEIIAGERRWRAAQQAQRHTVPVIVRRFTDPEALEVALIENLQRQDLSPLEEADGYRRLMEEFQHSQEDLGRTIGKSRSHVANMLRLLNLPDNVKPLVDDGSLSAGHARALLGAENPEAVARQVVNRNLNVRQTEKLVQEASDQKGSRKAGKASGEKDADTQALERDLAEALGMKVSITAKDGKGTVTVHYESLDQLDEVARRLNGAAPRAGGGPEAAEKPPAIEGEAQSPDNGDIPDAETDPLARLDAFIGGLETEREEPAPAGETE